VATVAEAVVAAAMALVPVAVAVVAI
jgi:hypothetical protein